MCLTSDHGLKEVSNPMGPSMGCLHIFTYMNGGFFNGYFNAGKNKQHPMDPLEMELVVFLLIKNWRKKMWFAYICCWSKK